jgi:PAS domain S-box-containing protein
VTAPTAPTAPAAPPRNERSVLEGAAQEVLDALREGCLFVDRDWRYRYVNDVAEAQGGLPRERLLGRTMMESHPGVERTPVFAAIQQCVVDRTHARLEVEYARPDGVHWFDVRLVPIEIGVCILSVDITERKRLEEMLRAKEVALERANRELRRNEDRLNETQRISKIGGWELDVASGEITWTDEVYRIHGVGRDFDPGDPVRDMSFYVPEDEKKVAAALARAAKLGEPYDLEVQLINAQKEARWARTVGHVERKDGEVARVFGNIIDITEGKLVEDALRESAHYARSLIEASLDPFVTIDVDGKISDVNDAAVALTGLPRATLVGSDVGSYFTEPEKAREACQQAFAQGLVRDVPLTFRHEGGRLADVLLNASTYRDSRGNVRGVFAAARDVTEAKQNARELRETKSLLESIVQSSVKYSIIGKDLERRIVVWNEGARRNYGYVAAEIVGKSADVLHTPEDVRSGAAARLLRTAAEKGLAEGQFERVRKDGTRFIASLVATRRDDDVGEHLGYLVISSDITNQVRSDEQLRSVAQYSRSLIEASLDPLVTISAEGKITDVNEATVVVTGVPRASLVGTDFSDYFTDPSKAREGYRHVFANGRVTDYALTIRHKDGRLTPVLYNAAVYCDASGDVAGAFAAARDVTAQYRAEEEIRRLNAELERRVVERTSQLEASNRELEAFSYSVSHDLRAPLRAADGFTRILQEDYGPRLDDEGRRVCAVVRESTRRMGQLIDALLAFSRLGRAELRVAPIDMTELAKAAFAESTTPESRARIAFHVDPLPPVEADPTLLKQVWANLLGNAVKFSALRERASIRVTGERRGAEAIYAVTDNGAGFDMRYADKLFGVFQRLHSAREFEGTGVGLALVARIVQRHGGRVWGEGETDRGATFRFALPKKETDP